MMTLTRITVAVVLVGLAAVPARAQHKDFVNGFYIGGEPMLAYKAVQAELKVSPEQAAGLDAIVTEVFTRLREEDRRNWGLPPEVRLKKTRELRQIVLPEMHATVATILSPDRLKRFTQIQLQQAGIGAYNRPSVQAKLGLTDEQIKKFKEIYSEMARNINEIIKNGVENAAADRDEDTKKIDELKKQAAQEAHALLTESQKAMFKGMTGEPFEVKHERLNF
jgi:hypothetical protein